MKLLILTTQDRFFLSHVLERAQYIKDKGWEIIVATEKQVMIILDVYNNSDLKHTIQR